MHGVLVVAKPAGPTSHDVVALVRRLAGTRRIGHGGTLDPFASGVLPLFLGGATRLVEYHLADDKALPRHDLLRRHLDDRRPRRRADAGSGEPARDLARGGRCRARRVPRAAAAAAARLSRRSRSAAGAPTRWRARARRVDLPLARGRDPAARPRSSGTSTDPDRPIAIVDVAAPPARTCGRWLVTSARDSDRARTSARSSGPASGPFRLEDARIAR